MRKWMLVLLPALGWGCSDPTGERDFRLAIREVAEPIEPGASVVAELGGMHVSGGFLIPCEGGTVRGELDRPAARELVLTIEGNWPAECNDVTQFYTYDAIIEALASDAWNLTVLHDVNGPGAEPDTVLHQQVIVP